jgi:hypothetical protein
VWVLDGSQVLSDVDEATLKVAIETRTEVDPDGPHWAGSDTYGSTREAYLHCAAALKVLRVVPRHVWLIESTLATLSADIEDLESQIESIKTNIGME